MHDGVLTVIKDNWRFTSKIKISLYLLIIVMVRKDIQNEVSWCMSFIDNIVIIGEKII